MEYHGRISRAVRRASESFSERMYKPIMSKPYGAETYLVFACVCWLNDLGKELFRKEHRQQSAD